MEQSGKSDLVDRFGEEIRRGRFTIRVGEGILHDNKTNRLHSVTQADLEILVLLDEKDAMPREEIEGLVHLMTGKDLNKNTIRHRLDDLIDRCPGVVKKEGKRRSNKFGYRLARMDED